MIFHDFWGFFFRTLLLEHTPFLLSFTKTIFFGNRWFSKRFDVKTLHFGPQNVVLFVSETIFPQYKNWFCNSEEKISIRSAYGFCQNWQNLTKNYFFCENHQVFGKYPKEKCFNVFQFDTLQKLYISRLVFRIGKKIKFNLHC